MHREVATPPTGRQSARPGPSDGSGAASCPAARARCVTHVIGRSSELTDFLFEELRALDDVRVIAHPYPPRRPWRNVLKAVDAYLLPRTSRSFYFGADYVEQLRRIGPDDKVLFFTIDNRKDLQIIRKFIAARELAVWLWNPIRSFRSSAPSRWWFLRWLRRAGIRAYTFDPRDARDFGLELTPQVFRHMAAEPDADAPRTDVYFVGADKGRLAELRAIEARLQRAGLSTHFHVVGDRGKRYDADERRWLRSEQLSYRENLDRVRRSRAVLEILQTCQSGATLRYVEALFLDRKLITNNRAIREAPGYDPSRFFILGEDDLAGLRAFVETPARPVCPRVLARHAIGTWLRQF